MIVYQASRPQSLWGYAAGYFYGMQKLLYISFYFSLVAIPLFYAYQLGGRTYTGIKMACEYTEEISYGVLIGKDEFGGKILYEYSSIPFFDFSDRQWDSLAGSFLIFDGTNIDLLQFRRGYCVAEIEVYENLLEADEEMKSWLERLEFPTGEINLAIAF